jgi:hypothetical protein
MPTDNAEANNPTRDDDRPTLYLMPEGRARQELARAEADLKFRAAYMKLLDEQVGLEQQPEELRPSYLTELDGLVAEYAHAIFFAFAREAVCGRSDVWIVRLALDKYLPVVIDEAYTAIHPFAKIPSYAEYRMIFSAMCEFVLTNSPAWLSLQDILREHAQIELDSSHSDGLASAPALDSGTPHKATPADNAVPWSDIEIFIPNDHAAQISIPGQPARTVGFEEMGFADGRATKGSQKPNVLWSLLLAFAQHKEISRAGDAGMADWKDVEQQVGRLNKQLRQYFNSKTRPISYRKANGSEPGAYRCAFKIKANLDRWSL